MDTVALYANVLNAVIFAVIGLVILSISTILFDKLTPGHLWKLIVEEKNLAMAIVLGSVILAMAHIIASAIHG